MKIIFYVQILSLILITSCGGKRNFDSNYGQVEQETIINQNGLEAYGIYGYEFRYHTSEAIHAILTINRFANSYPVSGNGKYILHENKKVLSIDMAQTLGQWQCNKKDCLDIELFIYDFIDEYDKDLDLFISKNSERLISVYQEDSDNNKVKIEEFIQIEHTIEAKYDTLQDFSFSVQFTASDKSYTEILSVSSDSGYYILPSPQFFNQDRENFLLLSIEDTSSESNVQYLLKYFDVNTEQTQNLYYELEER